MTKMTDWLVLIPTEFERRYLTLFSELESTTVKVCGFGPIVSAAKTAEFIGVYQPKRVMLLGIAGSYRAESVGGLRPGAAAIFSDVACFGVGVGAGENYETAGEMGWQQWGAADDDPIGDVIQLNDRLGFLKRFQERQLLTVCAASGNKEDVSKRLRKFPNAVAEDMEGFAVATACQFFRKPLVIIRGISNLAGDREKSNWKIEEALASAQSLAVEIIRNVGN